MNLHLARFYLTVLSDQSGARLGTAYAKGYCPPSIFFQFLPMLNSSFSGTCGENYSNGQYSYRNQS